MKKQHQQSPSLCLIHDYLQSGGLYNPEFMEHGKVRDMIMMAREEIEQLRDALIRRHAEQSYPMPDYVKKALKL